MNVDEIKKKLNFANLSSDLRRWFVAMSECIFCAQRLRAELAGAICDGCRRDLVGIQSGGAWPSVQSVYRYEGRMRELIVKAKAKGGVVEFNLCAMLFVENPNAASAARWCDLILAAPPSFWSRVRMRPHLATQLAWSLGKRYSKPTGKIVTPIFWRVRKQALKHRHERKELTRVSFRLSSELTQFQRILVVDDVRTSGRTLTALIEAIQVVAPESQIQTLVMANAALPRILE